MRFKKQSVLLLLLVTAFAFVVTKTKCEESLAPSSRAFKKASSHGKIRVRSSPPSSSSSSSSDSNPDSDTLNLLEEKFVSVSHHYTYDPTDELPFLYKQFEDNLAEKPKKKKKKDSHSGCCQICVDEFYKELVLLELPVHHHKKSLERFKAWHSHLQAKQQSKMVVVPMKGPHADCYKETVTGRPAPVYVKIEDGEENAPGMWRCPDPENDRPPTKIPDSVCCDICPENQFPDIEYKKAHAQPHSLSPERLAPPHCNVNDMTKDCEELKRKCRKNMFSSFRCKKDPWEGTTCDPNKPVCGEELEPYPNTDRIKCCELCVQPFVADYDDYEVEDDKEPRPYRADENGYLKGAESESNLDLKTKKLQRDSGSFTDFRKEHPHCCYPCASGDYNVAPGDSKFGEPQSVTEKTKDIFNAMGAQVKDIRNQREYYIKSPMAKAYDAMVEAATWNGFG